MIVLKQKTSRVFGMATLISTMLLSVTALALATVFLTATTAKSANPWDSYYSEALGNLPLNEISFIKDHNSYDQGGKLVDRLNYTNVLELDLYPKKGGGDWHVKHWPTSKNKNNCGSGYGTFKRCLSALHAWHLRNPGHPLIIINVDFKTNWLPGNNNGNFEKTIHRFFSNREIFRPKDLKGTHRDLRHAALRGWPKWNSLKDKFMFIITGGLPKFFNAHQSQYLKGQIMGDAKYRGVAFVCPIANDPDDVIFLYYSKNRKAVEKHGDLDQINKEKRHIACVSAKWKDRKKFDTVYVRNSGLIMHFWDVPASKKAFQEASKSYRASIIAPPTFKRGASYMEPSGRGGTEARIQFMSKNYGRGNLVGQFSVPKKGKSDKFNCKKSKRCKNDDARSVTLWHVPKGTKITVYDRHGKKHSKRKKDDWTEIWVRKQVPRYMIKGFQKSFSNKTVKVKYHKKNGLNGKVTYILISR